MPDRHRDFVHDGNIVRFEQQLKTEMDPVKRELLLKLLAEEKAWKLPHPASPAGKE
jgi:hypothetical protein